MIHDSIKYGIIGNSLACLSLSFLKRINGDIPFVGYYHIVSEEDVPHVKYLYKFKNTYQFTLDIEYLLKHYYPINHEELLDYIENGRLLPKNSFLLTFDDGFKENYDVIAPILHQKGFPAIFFLTTDCIDNQFTPNDQKISLIIDHIEKKNDWRNIALKEICNLDDVRLPELRRNLMAICYTDEKKINDLASAIGVDFENYRKEAKPYLEAWQIRKLIDMGFGIGSHSKTHKLFMGLPMHEQISQTVESLGHLNAKFKIDYRFFSFPHTEVGVSKDYFMRLDQDKAVQAFFGTRGLVKDEKSNIIQRINLESPPIVARKILGAETGRNILRKIKGSAKILRA